MATSSKLDVNLDYLLNILIYTLLDKGDINNTPKTNLNLN